MTNQAIINVVDPLTGHILSRKIRIDADVFQRVRSTGKSYWSEEYEIFLDDDGCVYAAPHYG